jgi:hypothetical protein
MKTEITALNGVLKDLRDRYRGSSVRLTAAKRAFLICVFFVSGVLLIGIL